MEKEIDKVLRLFHQEGAIAHEVKEIRQEEDDSRWIVYVELRPDRSQADGFRPGGLQADGLRAEDSPAEKFVIKIAANDFTSKERIYGWVEIIAAYRELGCYSPAIRKSVHGNYAETVRFGGKECVAWEEEYAKYHLRSALEKSVYTDRDGRYVYHDEVLAFLGKVAGKHYDFFPYHSGWTRLEPFGAKEETDEVTECVETFGAMVRERAPGFLPRWERVLGLFEENKRRLAGIYGKLPTSVFQSDHFGDNLLLDQEGHFKGVIDYNLAGKDTAINVFLYTILFGYHYNVPQSRDPEALPEYNGTAQDFMIQSIADALRYLRNFYTFTEAEAKAMLPLYKYVTCIEYRQIEAFRKYQEDEGKLNLLFDRMEYELAREEDPFYDVMMDRDVVFN